MLPMVVVLLLAIGDLARLSATMITIESAAREAADYGANGGGSPEQALGKWAASALPATVAEMRQRACSAARTLPDFAGSETSCSNPTFACSINGADCSAAPASCSDPASSTPCAVRVTLTYDFELIASLTTITFQRDSLFNVAKRGTP